MPFDGNQSSECSNINTITLGIYLVFWTNISWFENHFRYIFGHLYYVLKYYGNLKKISPVTPAQALGPNKNNVERHFLI